MPTGRAVFTLSVPIERAWRFLSDMQQVGKCVPGCQEVKILDDTHSMWRVRAELGPFSRTLEMATETVDMQPPGHGAFVATGKDMVTRGQIELQSLTQESTQVTYILTAEAQGMAKGLMNNAIALVVDRQAADFARNVVVALDGKG